MEATENKGSNRRGRCPRLSVGTVTCASQAKRGTHSYVISLLIEYVRPVAQPYLSLVVPWRQT